MNRYIMILPFASATTIGLFAFMAYLIENEEPRGLDYEDPVVVELYQLPKESKPNTINRKPIQAPEPPPKMKMARSQVETSEIQNEIQFTAIGMDIPAGKAEFSLGTGMKNNDARPIVRSNPRYPIEASQHGIEGWVKLGFDINELGEVINISVIDSQPKRLFDKAAKSALKKWKYKAKIVDGKPVIQSGITVQLDFNMQQQI
ncbi:energy transducer TonB [Thalassotalea marina]|uniref:Protein TonB n=1 Tax=Thalassotalea marina TaxID=1673741 RepID=A0A919BP67_9GAMM|nr:energy transducer TonB [Thalassotalea marina]GHG02384.1 protein TonB [Thalassotalea marina]